MMSTDTEAAGDMFNLSMGPPEMPEPHWQDEPDCESPKSRLRRCHACYCLRQSDLVSPGIQIEDPQSVSPR